MQWVKMVELFAAMLRMEAVNNHKYLTCVTYCYLAEQQNEMAVLQVEIPVWMSKEILNKENKENTITLGKLGCC